MIHNRVAQSTDGSKMTMDAEVVVPAGYTRTLFNIEGHVAVITGAGSGLGAAIAIGYAQAGAKVVLTDIDGSGLEQTASLIHAQGGSAESVRLDVTDSTNCREAALYIASKWERVDILVNSAGTAYRAPAEEFPEEKFDAIINLNLKGTYLCCQAFGNHMLTRGKGSIINIASIGSFVAYPWASAYLASKGGVLQLTRSLALEWRSRNVRVNGIGPTLMESPLANKAALTASITSDFIRSRMIRPRLGLPRELIGAAIFLGSGASELVTGQIIMCDDGYLVA